MKRKQVLALLMAVALGVAGAPALTVQAAELTQAQSLENVKYGTITQADKELLASMFDYEFYKTHNQDAVDAFGDDQEKLFEHFCTCGLFEGRSPSANFNVSVYASAYPDAAAAANGDIMALYRNYATVGASENQTITTLSAAAKAGITVHLITNPDIDVLPVIIEFAEARGITDLPTALDAFAAAARSVGCGGSVEGIKITPEIIFYIVRHGRTVGNDAGLAFGWTETPLNEEGIAMAQKLHDSFADIDFDACYSSPTGRAVDTANYILEGRDVTIRTNDNLREINYGDYEGIVDPIPLMDVMAQRAGYPYGRMTIGWENGETMAEAGERFTAGIEEIVAENPNGGTFLVTTHGGSATEYLHQNFGDTDTWNEFVSGPMHGGMPNCATTIVRYADGEYTLESIADTSYLQ